MPISSNYQRFLSESQTHRVNTLTELCRIERVAASCENEDDARAFQEPMTNAWKYYVTSNQFLTELSGLTRNYPFSSDLIDDALYRVQNDPDSNRSWNLPWLCLTKIKDLYANAQSWKREMWGGRDPSQEEAHQLAQYFEDEWTQAVDTMLRHWSVPPARY
ncbi:hypothetical protein DL765_001814 [Monosporascus sp. GIB2]|nr:hypothetical protein DL765_001814 [Monosporascus sp. GIB2]